MSKVLEIESTQPTSVELPIASFPPFKLRSSMVDKDPVIWVHLIEVYIQYIQTVLQLQVPLTTRSEQQLQLFVKTYLHEIGSEQGQILSLGLINVQITENLDILRKWVFELIKQLGVLELKLNGEALWDFAKIYAIKNSNAVRGLIDGSLKPRSKKTINSISQVQKHIEHLIGNSKFDALNMKILAVLLNDAKQRTTKTAIKSESKVVRKNKPRDQITPFGEKFVTTAWLEILENFYAKGEGRFASLVQKIAVLSLINLSTHKVASLSTELGATSMHSLRLYPLFGGIITSTQFQQNTPGLEKKLPFLIKSKSHPKIEVNQDDVQTLIELFPDLTISNTEKLLRKYKNDVEQVTHLLLENPEALKEVEDSKSSGRSRNKQPFEVISKKVINKHTSRAPDETKTKTLSAALKLLYEPDEDERDDTYDEAEATSGTASASDAKHDAIEKYLWELLRKDQTLFAKTQRKTKIRKEMRDQTKWSDEQIEGWARMLERSPKRFKILEEKYMFRGNKPWNSSFTRPADSPKIESLDDEGGEDNEEGERAPEPKRQSGNNQPQSKAKTKIQQARNEKNKSSRANHNRKSGHDKKMSRGFG